jgi:hypothetical protein
MQAADDAVGMARRLITALSLAALALPAPAAMASDIFTVAGTGAPGFGGDGGRSTAADLHYPGDVEATADAGFSGDRGPARGARMNFPVAVATRADGGVLIADTENHRIRLVEPLGEGPDWLNGFGRGGR